MSSPTPQHQASDEFSAAPRGLRRWAGAAGRRLARLVRRSTPPRWCIQDAYDFCERELERGHLDSELVCEVAELYAQPQLLANQKQPGKPTQSSLESRNPNTMKELANMAEEAFREHPLDAERRSWANEAQKHLRGCQQTSGAIENVATTLAFLRAAWWQARAAFSENAWEFPAEIAVADGRAVAVRDWCRTLPSRARLLDAGCGKGRYLKLIQRERSDLQLVGLDVATPALRQLPEGVEGREGHLLKLPAARAEFDAVLCVEALEHALLPRQAVAELCRVLRPGGSLLVIDKDRTYLAQSETQPWEVWFSKDDFATLLEPTCQQVTCRRLRHRSSSRASLFLAAQAIRRDGD